MTPLVTSLQAGCTLLPAALQRSPLQPDWPISKAKPFYMPATLPTCTLQVLRCNADRDAGYPDWDVSWFYSVRQNRCFQNSFKFISRQSSQRRLKSRIQHLKTNNTKLEFNVICSVGPLTEVFITLTEDFPCFFLSCKANARVKLAKTGHGPHSSTLFVICVVLCIVCV
jgi:hypothetical protein